MLKPLILLTFLSPCAFADIIVEPELASGHPVVEQPEPDFNWLTLLEKARQPSADLPVGGGPNWFVPANIPAPSTDTRAALILPEPSTLLLFGAGLLLWLVAARLKRRQ